MLYTYIRSVYELISEPEPRKDHEDQLGRSLSTHAWPRGLCLEMTRPSTYTRKDLHEKESPGKPQSNSDDFPLWSSMLKVLFSGKWLLPVLESSEVRNQFLISWNALSMLVKNNKSNAQSACGLATHICPLQYLG